MNQPHMISPEGFAKLKAEWEDLKFNQRPAMQKQVAEAAAEGDRSENAPYTYGKMRLRDIDRRLRVLDKLVDSAVIVDQKQPDDGSARFGCTVKLRSSTGQETEYQLVGTAEVDPLAGRISTDSPIGKALVGRKEGETVEVVTPRGKTRWQILTIRYN